MRIVNETDFSDVQDIDVHLEWGHEPNPHLYPYPGRGGEVLALAGQLWDINKLRQLVEGDEQVRLWVFTRLSFEDIGRIMAAPGEWIDPEKSFNARHDYKLLKWARQFRSSDSEHYCPTKFGLRLYADERDLRVEIDRRANAPEADNAIEDLELGEVEKEMLRAFTGK